MTMTAAVMYEAGLPTPYAESEPFRIEEVELDSPGPGEVLVEIRGAGVCHCDLSVVEGFAARPVPIVGGHEGAGIVREVGTEIDWLSRGDHVVAVPVAGCGACRYCRLGKPALCQAVTSVQAEGTLATGARRLRRADGGALNHDSGLSVYAQYAILTPDSLVRIEDDVPLDVAAMLGCGVLTGAGAVFNTAAVTSGASVAIVGLGDVGLSAVMAARESGAGTIIALDVDRDTFALARELGATHCIDADDDSAAEQVRDLTAGGVDHSFEVSGVTSAVALAHDLPRRGGEVVHVAASSTSAEFAVSQWSLVLEERTIRGSFMGGSVPAQDIPRYIQMFKAGRFPIDRLRGHPVGFEQLNESFDLLRTGAVIRQVLLPHGTP